MVIVMTKKSSKRKNTLILTVGLPRSGKSTFAKKLKYPIVNPDAIRLALHGNTFVPEAEKMVWTITEYMIKSLFLAGHAKVILDATNITVKRRDLWKNPMWVREFVLIDTSKEECIERAYKTKREDLIPIIENMSNQFEPISETEYCSWELDTDNGDIQ